MTTSENADTPCARCHRTAADLGLRLGRCSVCKEVHYRSADCQRLDRRRHKPQCRSQRQRLQQEQARSRGGASIGPRRLNIRRTLPPSPRELEPRTQNEPESVIYYLRASTPHLHRITISGPYKQFAEVVRQARQVFGTECGPGLSALDNLVIDAKDFWLFETISSPINGDENLVREVELIRENLFKPLLGSFPCTVWNVFYSKLHAPGWQDSSTDYAQLESRDVIGPFASQKEAELAARAKLIDLESNNGIERKHYSSK